MIPGVNDPVILADQFLSRAFRNVAETRARVLRRRALPIYLLMCGNGTPVYALAIVMMNRV